MKTVILCGGRGTRLNEETEFKPKPLVEVGGSPIITHIMKHYSAYGHNDFVLPLGYKGDLIKDYFLKLDDMSRDFTLDLDSRERNYLTKGADLGGTITFVNTGLESLTGSRVSQVRNHLQDDEDFFLTYGDAVSDVNLRELYDNHKSLNTVVTLSEVVPKSQYGVLKSDNGIVTAFEEKPEEGDATINGGYMVCSRRIFDYIQDDSDAFEDQLPILAGERNLGTFKHEGFWHSMDTQRDAQDLNKIWERDAPWKVWD